MGKLKIYEKDIMHASIPFKVSSKTVRVLFEGGTNGNNYRNPSLFSTSDEDLQGAIESSAMFKNGEIRLQKNAKIANSESDKNDNKGSNGNGDGSNTGEKNTNETYVKMYDTVTNTQNAKTVLSELGHELPVDSTTSDVIAKAKELELKFPKWVLYNK